MARRAGSMVDGEKVRAVTARGHVVAGDFAHVGALGRNVFPERQQVVPVHREAVFVKVDSGDFQPGRQEKAVAAHAAAQVVYGTIAGPEVRFPPPDILRGALLQREPVAQEGELGLLTRYTVCI